MNTYDPIEHWLAGRTKKFVNDSSVADGLVERTRLWADLTPHLPADAAGPWLIYRDRAGVVTVKIEKISIVGRAEDVDIRPGCPWLSRRHFELRPLADGCCLRDLGGRNPVKVNGHVTTERLLVSGDVLAVGDARFLYLFMPLPV